MPRSGNAGAGPTGRRRAPKRIAAQCVPFDWGRCRAHEGRRARCRDGLRRRPPDTCGRPRAGATTQLDHGGASIRTRSEPELLQQGDHCAASCHGTGCPWRVGNWGVGNSGLVSGRPIAQRGASHQIATPRPAGLDGVGARLPAGPDYLRGQRGRQTGIVAGPLVGSDIGSGAVEPGGTPAAMRGCAGSGGQPVGDQAVQMLADRVGVQPGQLRKSPHRAGLWLVYQYVQDARPCGR
jgi:hypothetical protein